jgi:hypothetical protein
MRGENVTTLPPFDSDGLLPPGDLEMLAGGKLQRDLNLLDEDKIWAWDPLARRPYRGYPEKQLPMWHKYRVELYPHVPNLGMPRGIRDRHGGS